MSQNAPAKELISFLEKRCTKIINVQTLNLITTNDDFSSCHCDFIAS